MSILGPWVIGSIILSLIAFCHPISGHRLPNCREYFGWKITGRCALNYYRLTERDTSCGLILIVVSKRLVGFILRSSYRLIETRELRVKRERSFSGTRLIPLKQFVLLL